ncbi:MAG: 1,4-alpha-glucan branching enzyme GlgB [Chlamydiae bacterium]|nr:1,4-alpha-glucan branching enzyme GlgB [Chlamydiota bacterium]
MQENVHDLLSKRQFSDPHSYLGLQQVDEKKKIIRIWKPGSTTCQLEICGKAVEATKVHDSGLYEYEVSSEIKPTDYRVIYPNGRISHDPYAFGKTLGDLDIHLVSRGLHYELYDLLGATPKVHQGVAGINFALWAPNAVSVSLLGDFNNWDGLVTPMRCIDMTGVWEIFMPGLSEGEKYKFEIVTKEDERKIKTDPVAHFAEMRPKNSSIVFDVSRFHWSDADWIREREKFRCGNVPITIYEIHPGSWQKEDGSFLNYRELASRLAKYCKKMHFTHVELIGISEHPLDESWGYQVTGYFAPTSRYGTPEDFQYFVNYLHEHQIGIILDWVPAHFPTDAHAIAKFDGTYLYEHMDPRQGYHPHWSTHIFNYGRWEVSNFLIASALFWFDKMHIDGLRVDAVSSMIYLDYGRGPGEWIPNYMGTNINLEALEFLKHMNSIIHQRFPEVMMIAEESTAFPGVTKEIEKDGLGFDYKWNLGWMNDTLRFFSMDFSERGQNLSNLTFTREYAFNEKFNLVLSHDEVVHEKKSLLAKMPGNEWEQMAGLRLLLGFMICFPGKKLLFMGGELGQKSEWNASEQIHWDLLQESLHAELQKMVAALNLFYLENGALFERDTDRESFEWVIHEGQENCVIAFIRKGYMQNLLCVHHLLPGSLQGYRIPLPEGNHIREIFNTDSLEWGGSGIINPEIEIVKGQAIISIAPLATQIFSIHE